MAEVEVWVADADALVDAAGPVLSAAETARAARYVSEPARRLFVVSRALQRMLGATHLSVPVDRVEIARRCRLCADGGDHGKPYLVGAAQLDYSVSHAGRLVLLAWSLRCRVGVDIEHLDRRLDPSLLGARTLAAAERADLDALPAADRPARFLRLWTRKEAAAKLAGHGLTVPLDSVRVDGPTAQLASPPPGWPAEPLTLTPLPVPQEYTATLVTTAEPQVRLREITDLAAAVDPVDPVDPGIGVGPLAEVQAGPAPSESGPTSPPEHRSSH